MLRVEEVRGFEVWTKSSGVRVLRYSSSGPSVVRRQHTQALSANNFEAKTISNQVIGEKYTLTYPKTSF